LSRPFCARGTLGANMDVATPITVRLRAGSFPWLRGGIAALGVAFLVAGEALIATDAASGGSPLVDDGRAIPHGLLGPLTGTGSFLYYHRFWGLIAVMFVGYGALLWSRVLPARAVGALVLALNLLAFAGPPLTSDVFSYIDYARLGAVHGVNPYAHTPAAIRHDAAFHYVAPLWRHIPSAYGPLFTLATYPAGLLGVVGGVWLLKGVALASSLALVVLVAACARRLGRDPAQAALLVGANPFLLIHGVEAAHNELVMMALAMLGVWLSLSGRRAGGAAAVVLGAAVKVPALLVLPFMLLRGPRRGRVMLGAALATAGVAAIAVAAFGTHAAGFVQVLARQQTLTTRHAFPTLVGRLFGSATLGAGGRLVLHLLLAAAVVYLLVRVWRGADWLSGAGWALLAAAVLTTWMLIWYTLWALPIAILARDRRLIVATLVVQALYLIHRLPPLVARL
jgi:hypothetical protein